MAAGLPCPDYEIRVRSCKQDVERNTETHTRLWPCGGGKMVLAGDIESQRKENPTWVPTFNWTQSGQVSEIVLSYLFEVEFETQTTTLVMAWP